MIRYSMVKRDNRQPNLRIAHVLVMVLMTLLITACSSMPMATMWKMSKLNPLEMDASGVSIAVVTHKAVRFAKDSVRIEMSYKTASPSTSQNKKFTAQMNDDALRLSGNDKSLLSSFKSSEEEINTFSLSKKNAKDMGALQRKMRTYKKNKVKGSGSFSVAVDNVCLNDPDIDSVVADIFVKFDKNEDYVLLIRGVDLLKHMQNEIATEEILCN